MVAFNTLSLHCKTSVRSTSFITSDYAFSEDNLISLELVWAYFQCSYKRVGGGVDGNIFENLANVQEWPNLNRSQNI